MMLVLEQYRKHTEQQGSLQDLPIMTREENSKLDVHVIGFPCFYLDRMVMSLP